MSKNKNTHNEPTQDQRWLSIMDFTALFGFSRATQQRLRSSGHLPHSKIGNVIRYDRQLIDDFFTNHSVA